MDMAPFSGENNDLLWSRLLKAKYGVSELFMTNPSTCSPFWHNVHKIKEAFKMGAKFHPGRNSNVSFWKDVCLREAPLSHSFPNLFEKCSDSELLISQACLEDGWNI
jgi:hypothetical protein